MSETRSTDSNTPEPGKATEGLGSVDTERFLSNQSSKFRELVELLRQKVEFLPDKPEETALSCGIALWNCAAGQSKAAGEIKPGSLPELTTDGVRRLESLAKSRIDGVPLAHLTGRQLFFGVELLTGPEALIPRRETEILARAALSRVKAAAHSGGQIRLLDICCGSGNVAVSLAVREPQCRVWASDLSESATALARKNVDYHQLKDRVEIVTGDLFSPFESADFIGSFDVITCNPPYLSTGKANQLPRETLLHEPSMAFDAGTFGMGIISRLIEQAPRFLKRGGWLCFEVGLGQGPFLGKSLRRNSKYREIEEYSDPQGAIRALAARAMG